MKAAPKRYNNLALHHWDRGGSQGSWVADPDRMVRGIVELIHEGPDDREWLIVHHKGAAGVPNLPKRLRKEVRNPDRLSFVNWGAHRATNEFGHIKHGIIAGLLYYPLSRNEAVARATIGAAPGAGGGGSRAR